MRIIQATLLALCAFLLCAATQAETPRLSLNIKSQPVRFALKDLGEQTGLQILFRSEDVAKNGITTPQLSGELSATEALEKLLAHSGLEYRFVNANTVLISAGPGAGDIAKPSADVSQAGDLRLAQTADERKTSGTSGTETASKAADNKVQEIVVTATKRQENLQNVPMSISVLSNQEIDRKGIVGMAEYLRTLPGVNEVELGAGQNSMIMRGVAASPQSSDTGGGSTAGAGGGATVGYYLNDIPLTGYALRGGADVKLIDLQRVEVIRGPQGTLFGGAALGGAVRNIPNAPDPNRFDGYVKGGYSFTDKEGGANNSIEGVLNVPLVAQKLAVRAVAYRFDNSGYVKNVAGSNAVTLAKAAAHGIPDLAVSEDDVGTDEYVGARLAVLYQPTDRFKATLTYLTQDITQEGLPDVELFRTGLYQQTRLRLSDRVGGGTELLKDDLDIYGAALEYGFGWGTLVSSTAWVTEDYLEKRDIGAFFSGGTSVAPQRNLQEADAFVQEVRFVSDFQGPMQFLLGLYYDDVDRKLTSQNYYGGRVLSLSPYGCPTLCRFVGSDRLTDNTLKQKAVFGEVSYAFNEQFKLTVGGRGFKYDELTVVTDRGTDVSPPVAGSRLRGENNGSTFKVNTTYSPTDDAMLYAQWSQGFRVGHPVARITAVNCDLNSDGLIDGTGISTGDRTLDPDSLDSYEVGAKLAFMESALVVNAAVYRNRWTGVPVTVISPTPCGGVAANAGEARTEGFELSSDYRLTRALRVSVGGSYVDAALTKDTPSINGLKGDRLPGSPRYTINTGAEYEFDVLDMPAYIRGDYAYVGGFFNNLKQTGLESGNYGTLNLRAGLTRDRIGVDLYVNNVTNSDAITWVHASYTGLDTRAFLLKPRTIGLGARFRF